MREIRTSGSMSGRGWETERCRMAQATAPILDSTWAAMPGCLRLRRVSEGKRTLVGLAPIGNWQECPGGHR